MSDRISFIYKELMADTSTLFFSCRLAKVPKVTIFAVDTLYLLFLDGRLDQGREFTLPSGAPVRPSAVRLAVKRRAPLETQRTTDFSKPAHEGCTVRRQV